MNQDSRRKLKQVYHLFQFIEPLLKDVQAQRGAVTLADHGAGKSYLGFILYDLFFKEQPEAQRQGSHIYGIETREELVKSSEELARRLGFGGMSFLNLSVAESITSDKLPRPSTWSPPCTPATPPPTTRSVSRWRKGQVHRGRALLPGGSGVGIAQEQGQGIGRSAGGNLAASAAHAGVREPDHQCAALLAAGSARVSGQRDRAGRVGALDEERADHRAVQGSAEKETGGTAAGDAGEDWVAGVEGAVFLAEGEAGGCD